MKFAQARPLADIAAEYQLKIIGDPNQMVFGINEIHKVVPGDITYVDVEKYYNFVLESEATFIIIDQEMPCPEGKTLLISKDPFAAYNAMALNARSFVKSYTMQADDAIIGEGTHIQPNVFIGNNVIIGKNCLIHPNVTIYDNVTIGDNVIIQSNTSLGCDAFYYKSRNDQHEKMHTIGRTIIEDDVVIGSNCTISAGVSGDTIIGQGSKLDNLIHIGHGAVIGKHCLMAAQVAVAGKTIVGDNVFIYGKVGINKDLRIGDRVTILGASNVGCDLEAGKTYFGTPAIEARQKWREISAIRRLPDVLSKLLGSQVS